jgi:hypothetical protein
MAHASVIPPDLNAQLCAFYANGGSVVLAALMQRFETLGRCAGTGQVIREIAEEHDVDLVVLEAAYEDDCESSAWRGADAELDRQD